MSRPDPPGWLQVLIMLTATAASLWGLWCVVIGFTGGTLPLLGIHIDGGLITGALMLFIGEPILATLAYWAAGLVFLPLIHLTTRSAK